MNRHCSLPKKATPPRRSRHADGVRKAVVSVVVLAVLGWHGLGLWRQYGPMPPEHALHALHSGVANRYERERCLSALRDQRDPAPRWRVIAAAAALALGDRAACAAFDAVPGPAQVVLFGRGAPWSTDEPAVSALCEEASFGEHWLRHYLFGRWLQAKGDPRAAEQLAQAAKAAVWSEASLAAELARGGK